VPRTSSLAWNRSGDAIYYLRDLGSGANVTAAGDVMKLRITRSTGEPRGTARVVLGGVSAQEFSLSVDGRQLAYTKATPRQKIWAMTLSGPPSRAKVDARELTTGTSLYGTPDISPDGELVAFARNDGGTGNLYVTPFARYEPRPLVISPRDEWSPRWSPDGRLIAYAVRDPQSRGILAAEAATGRVRRIAGAGLAPLGVIAWMAGGREVVFPLDLGRHYAITDLATGRMDSLVTPDSVYGGFHLTVPSPDGRHLAVNVMGAPHGGANVELWAVNRAGEPWKRYDPGSHTQVSPLLWTADGWIYYLASGKLLYRVPANGGPARRVSSLPQTCSRWQTALSANARRLVCTVSETESDIWIADAFDPKEDR
jgi:dipeptidyl aminopeptidase/acylaminoacyl peptidase